MRLPRQAKMDVMIAELSSVCPRSLGLVVIAVACGARGYGFNPISFQMIIPRVRGSREVSENLQPKIVQCSEVQN